MLRIAGDGSLRWRHFGLPSVTLHSQSKEATTLTPVSSCFAYRVSQPFGGPLPKGEAPQNFAFKNDSIFWQGALVQAGRCGSFSRCPLSCKATMYSNTATAAKTVFSHLRTDIVCPVCCLDIKSSKARLVTLTIKGTHPGTRLTASYPCGAKAQDHRLPVCRGDAADSSALGITT